MRIIQPIDISNVDADNPDFSRYTSQLIGLIVSVLNGEVDLVDNAKTSLVKVTFNVANVQQAVNHTLNKLPKGYIQVGSLLATQLYNGTLINTKTTLYVQSSVATTVSLLVF